jgi:cytochrome c biogenesis protein CcmG/thiol:disulfide interchange protein DsbE
MKKIIFVLFMFISSIAMFGCQKSESREIAGEPEQYKPKKSETTKAPDFTLKTTDGKELKLTDYKGKLVILDFWATWCGPCRRGIPDLIEIQKEYKDDIVIIGISLDRLTGTEKDLIPFMKEFKINYPVVIGTESVTKSYGGIQSIPTSFVLDRKGNVIDYHVGLVPKSTYINVIKKNL